MTIKEFKNHLDVLCMIAANNSTEKKWSVCFSTDRYTFKYKQGERSAEFDVHVPMAEDEHKLDMDFYRVFCLNFTARSMELIGKMREVEAWAKQARKSAPKEKRDAINERVSFYKSVVKGCMFILQALEIRRENGTLVS